MKPHAIWRPGSRKDVALGKQLPCYNAYELEKRYGLDNKNPQLSSPLVTNRYYYPVYYLGNGNLRWSDELDEMFLDHVESSPPGVDRPCGSSLLLGENWDLAENLVIHAINPRSRLIHFTGDNSFYYFTLDDMGPPLLQLILDDTCSAAFQRYFQQMVCGVSPCFRPICIT